MTLTEESTRKTEERKYLDDIWKSQQRAKGHYGDEGINYLKHLSSGGVTVLLAFIGATEWAPKNLYILWALGFFSAMLIGNVILGWYMYLRSVDHFNKFDQGRSDCISGVSDFKKVSDDHYERINQSKKGVLRIAAVISISLLGAIIFACCGFLSHYLSVTNTTTETQELSSARFAPHRKFISKFILTEPQTA